LRRYTEEHPDVVAVKKSIAQLEEQRKQELAAMAKAAAAAPRADYATDKNPVSQQLKVSVADAEANVAALRARLSSLEGQYAQLKSAARMVPQVEAEFAQLNRDYDIQKKTYETLLARRQSATIGEGVQDAGGTQFRVIDPPRVSPQPVPPTRLTLLVIAILLAIGIGFLASFVASEIMPTFHDGRTLAAISKRPMLGMVTMLQSETLRNAKRRDAWLFAGGLGSLVASFVAILTVALLLMRVA